MVNAANNLGLISKAYRCELNDLCTLKFPLIAHLKFENNFFHFVIIDKIVDDEIYIFDPIRGNIKYLFEDFEKEWTNIIITFEYTKNIVKEKEISHKTDFMNIINRYKKIILSILLFSIMCTMLSGINSLYFSNLYNNSSIWILIIFLIFLILRIIIELIRNAKLLNFNKKLDIDITNKTYNKILSLPIEFHHNRPVGDVVSRINDLSNIKNFITEVSFSSVLDMFFILIICLLLFLINKVLFSIALLFIILFISIHVLSRNKINELTIENKENMSSINTLLIESIVGIDTIKNLNIETNVYSSYKDRYLKLVNNNILLSKLSLYINLTSDFLINFGIIIILFIGIKLVNQNIISFANLIAFNSLLFYLFSSIKNIINIDNSLIDAKNSFDRLQSLFKEENKKEENTNIDFKNKISVKNLKYSYDGVNNILSNVEFNIKYGEFVFIKGESGIGKSTIFKLLTKQLTCADNSIYIDGIDINKISRNDVVNNICYVSQNEYIFTDSILNNIKMFKDIDDEEIDKVLKITMLDKVLKNKNIDLDFILEENGQNVSGGEKQKILLARSLLRNKKILILDETMNEIDVKSERKILEKIKTEYDITLILISHRNINSDLFDRVVTIE